jgi:hypothetical protein
MTTKKAGRPPMPKGQAKTRTNIRLNDEQRKIIYWGLDKEVGIQEAIEKLIEFKEKYTDA